MTELALGHLDDSERPCERHRVDRDTLLHLAAIGSRSPGFNHDIASKIQGLMMAMDEISELVATPELELAAETAQTALGELNQLLQQSRAFTKPPVSARCTLQELLTRAAARVGVTLRGAPATQEVEVAVPLVTQAFTLLFDGVAGAARRRVLELGVSSDAGRVELTFPIAIDAVLIGESLAIAAWIFARERGELRCSEQAIVVRLPVS